MKYRTIVVTIAIPENENYDCKIIVIKPNGCIVSAARDTVAQCVKIAVKEIQLCTEKDE